MRMQNRFSVRIALCLLLLAGCFWSVAAEEETEQTADASAPYLTSLSFYGAEINEPFEADRTEYTLSVTDHTNLALKEYEISDNTSKISVASLTDDDARQYAMEITVSSASGETVYHFRFSNLKEPSASTNALLASISFPYGQLDPEFQSNILSYILYLPTDLEVLQINAVAEDPDAVVSGPVEIILGKEQTAPISITVTAGDNETTMTYRLSVQRVHKTVAQVREEMQDPDYNGFATPSFFRSTGFFALLVALLLLASGGIMYLVYREKTKRIHAAQQLPPSPGKPEPPDPGNSHAGTGET
ncbi:MAG: cadherin-like beta sandwich domain-containing protein, partial [Clostridiales bacterium]|nr:cadherin-like beta sandwich domain-containing protein [Clostridiales bacterium]